MSLDENYFGSYQFKNLTRGLKIHGQAIGPYMPWHLSLDPYKWLVAEQLLRRTTRVAAEKAYEAIIEKYPSWIELATANPDSIYELFGEPDTIDFFRISPPIDLFYSFGNVTYSFQGEDNQILSLVISEKVL